MTLHLLISPHLLLFLPLFFPHPIFLDTLSTSTHRFPALLFIPSFIDSLSFIVIVHSLPPS